MINPQSIPLVTGLLATALLASMASAQNTGIGTLTPKSKLSVNGSTASGGIAVGDATYTSTTGTVAPLNGAIIQGRVGIGTPTPTQRLHVLDGNILRDNSDGTASTIITTDGAIETFRLGTGSGTKGFFDLKGVETDDFGGRIVFWKGSDGSLAAPNNTGEGLGFTTDVSNGVPQMLLDKSTGNVGIGDLTPTEAKLVVRGLAAGTFGTGLAFNSNSGSTLQAQTPGPAGFSIYTSNSIGAAGNLIAAGAVMATSTLTPSDTRLKNIIGESNTTGDLQTLNKIKITNYTMKDASVLGSGEIKKVIAQQVEEVYPQAVTKTDGYLPDIYMSGTSQAKDNGLVKIETGKAHGLKAGDQVKVFTADGEPVFGKVETTDGASFTAKLELVKDGEKVFVYGRHISDLRTVDYDALSMLNVSATQELAKEVVELKTENEKLKAQVQKFDALAARMEAMEKSMAASTNVADEAIRTVSLTK